MSVYLLEFGMGDQGAGLGQKGNYQAYHRFVIYWLNRHLQTLLTLFGYLAKFSEIKEKRNNEKSIS